MTRKEKIIEVKGKISQAVADDRISQRCAVEIMNDIDAIFTLPIDVPSEEEITNEYPIIEITEDLNSNESNEELMLELRNLCKRIGAKWAIDEIIKRNKI